MTKNFKKITLSVATSAILVGNAFALDPAITNFGYVGGDGIPLSIFDASDPTKIKSITGLDDSTATAIDPTGKYFYVIDYDNNNMTKYNSLTGAVVSGATVTVGSNPVGIALNYDGSKAFITNNGSDTVSIINTATNTVIDTVTVGSNPHGITLNSDGSKAFVTNYTSHTVSVIDTTTNTVTATVAVGSWPGLITLNSDGSKAYVTNNGSNTVSVIDTTTNTVTATVAVGSDPQGMTLTSDGSKLYVANTGSSSISIIDTTTNTVIQTITGIDSASALSISPDGSTIYVRSVFTDKLFTINTSDDSVTTYTGYGTGVADDISPSFISANLVTGTLEASSSAELEAKGFTNYVNFAGGTLRATGSFTLSNPIYLHDEFDLTWDDSTKFETLAGGTVDTNGYNVEFSGDISGVGGLTKSGIGKLTISGANTYAGDTVVNTGTLEFTGNRTLGVFEVQENAFLNVTGDLTLTNSSIYKVHANRLGESGQVAVTGTANLDGTVEVKADNSGTWNTTTNYEILTASVLNGTFDSVSSDLAFLTPTLSYEADKVNLTLTRNTVEYKEKATNSQSYKSASVLDEISSPNTTMQSLFTVLDGMNDTQAATALNRLSGAPLAINTIHSIPTNLSTFSSAVFARLSRANTIGLGGLMFADGDDSMYNTYKILHDGGYMDENGFIKDKPQYSYWTRVIGAKSKLDGDSIRSATDSTTKGIQVGVEKTTNDLIIGTSFAYMGTDVDFADNEAKSDVKTYILGFYGQKTFDNNIFINLETNLSQNSTETSRLTPTGWASSKPKSNSLSATLEVGYKYETSKDLFIKPSIIGGYSHIEQKGYTESGAGGANLSIDKYKADISNLGLNLKVQKIYTQNNKDIADIEFGMGYIRDFGDTNKALNASFASAPSAGNFAINGIEKDKNKYTANITTNYYLNKTTNIFAAVNGMKSSNERTVNGFVGIKVGF